MLYTGMVSRNVAHRYGEWTCCTPGMVSGHVVHTGMVSGHVVHTGMVSGHVVHSMVSGHVVHTGMVSGHVVHRYGEWTCCTQVW